MGLFNFIKKLFSGKRGSNLIHLYLQDNKCGEKIKVIFRKSYDIQRVYKEDKDAAYRIKKVVVCNNCYNKIDIDVKFDKRYQIIEQKIDNGKFITEEEYEKDRA